MARFVDQYLGYLLGQANHAVFKAFEAQVAQAGLSSIEWRVLATLQGGDAISVTELAHEVLAKQPTVTKLVQRMQELGWLRLCACPQDQRRTLVQATAKGRKLVEPLLRSARRDEAALLEHLGTAEVAQLKSTLRKIALLPPQSL
jgi:DNA-binding MarR family transcriptional regulator